MKQLGLASLVVYLVFVSDVTPAANAQLLPSEVTTLISQAMRYRPDAERTSITRSLISRMKRTELSEIEYFLKGEAHFLNFEPEKSRDVFWEFRGRTDNFGRVAAQRLVTIRVNAFDMVDQVVNSDIPAYRDRFGVRPDDRYGISYPLMQAALRLVETDQPDRALDLVVDEVRRHDKFDSPYDAYRLPGRFMAVARSQDREDEFLNLHQWVLDGLDSALRQRMNSNDSTIKQQPELPGVVFFSLFEDQGLEFHDWTAEFLKLRSEIADPNRST